MRKLLIMAAVLLVAARARAAEVMTASAGP